jgi:hypothetical protein
MPELRFQLPELRFQNMKHNSKKFLRCLVPCRNFKLQAKRACLYHARRAN